MSQLFWYVSIAVILYLVLAVPVWLVAHRRQRTAERLAREEFDERRRERAARVEREDEEA